MRLSTFLHIVSAVAAFPAFAQSLPAAGGNAPGAPLSAQQTLDLFAVLPIPSAPVSAGNPYLPKGAFGSWTAEEQKAVPGMIAGVCRLVWIMAHDAPGTHILPKALPDADEELIGTDICIVGHMPVDWPGRPAALASATAIIGRAQAAGADLKMPKGISP